MSVPGSKLKPMITPQGSQRALEALTPAPRGRQMQNIIQSRNHLKAPTIAAPFKYAPPDGARWVSVGGDLGGPAGAGWVSKALATRRKYTTTTITPTPAKAAAVLRRPAKVPETYASVQAQPAGVPKADNIWAAPNQGKAPAQAPASSKIIAPMNVSGKLSEDAGAAPGLASAPPPPPTPAPPPPVAAAAAAPAADEALAGSGMKKRARSSSGSRLGSRDLARLLKHVLKRGGDGSDSDSDSDSDTRGGGFRRGGGGADSGTKKRRRPPADDSRTRRRARLVSHLMKSRGISLGEASRVIKAENMTF